MSNTQGSESFRDEERKKMMKFFDHVSLSSGSASDIVKQEEAVIDHLPAEEKLRSLQELTETQNFLQPIFCIHDSFVLLATARLPRN